MEDMSTVSPAAELRNVRPIADRIEMDDVRARAEHALFGESEPARLGRYVLLGRIAGGGMGVVYGAYDPELHRKVALKVLHPHRHDADRGDQRLLIEARALAKLDHPNVVKVHDVLTHGGQVVVVMVLVEGQTLATWQLAKPRSWREIVEVYRQAGEGLAAAHEVEVVHRDFKPANAIIGHDGRVQVLDFGLARFAGTEPSTGSASSPPIDLESTALTYSGQVVGTLGYMAPEQLDGAAATPACDQFSFCVALHRAIEGVAPFLGKDPAELRGSIARGVIAYAADGRSVPRWLRSVVRRGLELSPDDRYPSMRALLAQLGRERGWRRWRRSVIAAAAAVTVGVTVFALRSVDAPAPCDGDVASVDAIWDHARRTQIRDRLRAIGTPDARKLEIRVPEELDGYRAAWVRGNQEACQVYRRGAQSAEMFDRRMLCLRRRLDDLGATVHVLSQIEESSATKAIEAVTGMPSVADCADIEALNATSAPPATALAKAQVEGIRKELSQAAALDRVGRDRDALKLAEATFERAQGTGYPPVVVEAALLRGRILLFSHEYKAAVTALATAETVALQSRMYASAVEAGARRLFCEGVDGAEVHELEPQIALMSALGRGLRGDRFALPLLLNSIGVVYIANGAREPAARSFTAARAALVGVEQPDHELIAIEKNLAMVTADRGEREWLSRHAWEQLNRELGSPHPLTVEALEDYARYVMDPAVAVKLKTQACRLYEDYYPTQTARRANCGSHLAFLTSEIGDREGAARLYREIVALTADSTDEDAVVWKHIAAGELHAMRGELRAAISEYSQVVKRYAKATRWWERQWTSHAWLGIGLAEHALGSHEQAVAHLEQAVESYLDLSLITEQVENHQRLALARWALARSLSALGRPRERLAQLDDQARQFYRSANADAYRWRLSTAPP
jgi:tetratricopeptide (TPR) repeat protein